MYDKAFETSIMSDGIRVASPVALIAFKLGRFGELDKVDISQLIEYCNENNIDINIEDYGISEEDLLKFKELNKIDEKYHHNHYMLGIKYFFNNESDKIVKVNDESFPYDIYVINDGCNIPRFHFGKFDENYMFELEFDKDVLRLTGSSTDYPSFNMYRKEERDLKEWLSIESNLTKLNSVINSSIK